MIRSAVCSIFKSALLALLANSLATSAIAAEPVPTDSLLNGFVEPPMTARPRVWWHWMDGNVTQEGIAKDFDWMKRIGIGGVQHFDVGLGTRQVVTERVKFMSPEWKNAFRYAATMADQNDFELAIAASPGWSETGGPWVPPEDGMKKLVWSETLVRGGQRLKQPLPTPPSVTGPFQTIAGSGKSLASYYADSIVLAVPYEEDGSSVSPKFATGAGEVLDGALLSDGNFGTHVPVAMGSPDKPGIVTISYDSPVRMQSATIYVRDAQPAFSQPIAKSRLEVREGDGWRLLADIPLSHVPTTVSFSPIKARDYRLLMLPTSTAVVPTPKVARIAELALSSAPKVDAFEVKAGFAVAYDYFGLSKHSNSDFRGVAPEKVMDLTDRMKPDGTLDWIAPRGQWKVLRMGYSLLGKTNHPAIQEATGLEVDKYDRAAVQRYLDTYLGMYSEVTGPDLIGARGVRAILTDSIEVGASNWTPRLIEQFERLRKYDPRPWLPTLTGVVIGSRAQSDAFLYDFRRTLADLIASEHYGQVARSAHQRKLKVYGEALEGLRHSLGDDMAMRASADVPMAALWTYPREEGPSPSAAADMKGAASVAHVYGQNLVAAESMTSSNTPWGHAPNDLRRVIDYEFAHGVNLPVIHTSVHQAQERPPGLSLARFGQYFNRHETWAEMAKPWIDYIARNSFLLQQGRNVADVAYFYGEEAPLVRQPGNEPVRYAYDYVNSDVLLNQLSVTGRELTTKGGASYRALYLGGSSRIMTLAPLKRLAELVEAGATVIGQPPQRSPAFLDDPAEFDRYVQRLWSDKPVTSVGMGQVVANDDVEAALASLGIAPDFSYAKPQSDSEVLFVHRRLSNADIYYVNNRRNRLERIDAAFRVTGKQPEIWRADSGSTESVSYRIEQGTTIVPLELLPEESFFVVFRQPTQRVEAHFEKPRFAVVGKQLDGTWDVTFQSGRGAPDRASFDALVSLTERSEPGIKYFSGVATYTQRFALPKAAKRGEPLMLDLGQVGDVAEVRVNGRYVGTVWKSPYEVDIGKAVRSGTNEVEIRVANLWVNRLIGDAQPDATKVAFTAIRTYNSNAALRPAGLIGPVRVLLAE